SGEDEEYQRIYTTKIKPRLKAEEALEGEAGGTQSRTITVTRKVTAYTVDVSSHDGAGDLQVLGPELRVLVPQQEMPHPARTGVEGEVGVNPGGTRGGPDRSLNLRGPRVDSSPAPRLDTRLGEAPLGKVGPPTAVKVSTPATDPPPLDVGKVNFPVLKMPKFGFPPAGPGAEAQAPPGGTHLPAPKLLDVSSSSSSSSSVHLPASDLSVPSVQSPKVPTPQPEGEGPGVGMKLPKGQVVAHIDLPEVATEGDWKSPTFKKVETPQISLSDVNLKLKGPQVKGAGGVTLPQLEGPGSKSLRVEVEAPEVEGPSCLKGPGVSTPDVDMKGLKGRGEMDVSGPKMGGALKGLHVDVQGPKLGGDVPHVDLKGPRVKMPEMSFKTPQISTPDIDLNLKGPKVKGDLDVSIPTLGADLKGPGLDLKGPSVDLEAPEVDIHGPEGKVKMPKLKMPKFGVSGVKGEGPDVDVTLPKGGVDISGPRVEVDLPSVEIKGPEGKGKGLKLKMPELNVQTPKLSMPDVDLSLKVPKLKGDVDVSAPKLSGDLKGPHIEVEVPQVDVEVPEVDLECPEGKMKGPKFK
ncbi:AHNK protein, partial [Jacana jacana]|nr:AHNK protein [Jacana jacana]